MKLILGRFQPLHNGHLRVISDASKEERDIVIAIGSTNKPLSKENPFSADERRLMLKKTLKAEGIKAKLVKIPDIAMDNTYVKHVIKHVGGVPDSVITENRLTHDLFEKAGINVRVTPRYAGLSATDVRKRIATGNPWKHLVPVPVAKAIVDMKATRRIRRLYTPIVSLKGKS